MTRPSEVFLPVFEEGFQLVLPTLDSDMGRLLALDGTPMADSWSPLPMRVFREDELGKPLRQADFPFFGGGSILILSQVAHQVLAGVVGDDAEFLRLEATEPLVIMHPTRLLDALDEEYSEVTRFSSGRIMTIDRFELRPEAIAGARVFKLAGYERGPMLVTEAFVETVQRAGLKGLRFRKIWPDR